MAGKQVTVDVLRNAMKSGAMLENNAKDLVDAMFNKGQVCSLPVQDDKARVLRPHVPEPIAKPLPQHVSEFEGVSLTMTVDMPGCESEHKKCLRFDVLMPDPLSASTNTQAAYPAFMQPPARYSYAQSMIYAPPNATVSRSVPPVHEHGCTSALLFLPSRSVRSYASGFSLPATTCDPPASSCTTIYISWPTAIPTATSTGACVQRPQPQHTTIRRWSRTMNFGEGSGHAAEA